jgi:hypothetical protein
LAAPKKCLVSRGNNEGASQMIENITLKYSDKFVSLLKLQDEIKSIHPLLNEHFPIVIVENKQLNIFEYEKGEYVLSCIEPDLMNMPTGIRAAFPLECLQNKAVVIVSGEVFDTLSEQVIVFHEFVHCYQFHTCELQLRKQIELAKRSVNTEDYSWELNYPFPYENKQYIELTRTLFDSLDKKDGKLIGLTRRKLKENLTAEQVEYMVWQEWKEGFARYIENRIKHHLAIDQNQGGRDEPYRRTTFYETGSQLIDYIVGASPSSLEKIEELYDALKDDRYFVGM